MQLMDSLDLSKIDIVASINTTSILESNIFLRRFYNEISAQVPLGWYYHPYRNGNIVYVGDSNYGEMWFDYEVKGCIKNIYFKSRDKEKHEYITNIIEKILVSELFYHDYNICVHFEPSDAFFCKMCRNNIKIESHATSSGKFITNIMFAIKAFGVHDLKYILTQKKNYLIHLLCAYSNYCFKISKIEIYKNPVHYENNEWDNYDLENVDGIFRDDFKDSGAALLPDFFDLFYEVLNNDYYEKNQRLVLNSAQEIYCGYLLMENCYHDPLYNIPGYVDIVHTTFISALEPLSNINAPTPEQCEVCGNLKYKIISRIKEMCKIYLPEHIVREYIQKGYNNRSSFLHEGNAKTNEFYSGHCIPLINPNSPNEMLDAVATVNPNLVDYVLFVFRKRIHDYLVNNK